MNAYRTFSLSAHAKYKSLAWFQLYFSFFAIAFTFHSEALSLPRAHLSFLLFPRRFNHRNQITQLFILRLLLRVLLFVIRSFPACNVALEVETFVQRTLTRESCELLARIEISFSFSQGKPLRSPRELKISRHLLSALSLEKRKEGEKIIAHSSPWLCPRAFYAVSLFLPAPGEMVMFRGCYREGSLTVVTVDSQLVHGSNSVDRFDGGS